MGDKEREKERYTQMFEKQVKETRKKWIKK